jgi:2'-5' RNA ligase
VASRLLGLRAAVSCNIKGNEAMQQVGFRLKPATFLPHITLLYDKHRIREQSIEPIHWAVSEFVLIHSHIGQHRYTQLNRYPLLNQKHQSY